MYVYLLEEVLRAVVLEDHNPGGSARLCAASFIS